MTRVLPLLDARAIKVLDTIDVFSTKKDKVLRYGIRDFWLEPEEEARRLALADLVIAIQDEERGILQQLASKRTVITAGIDFDLVGDSRLPVARRILYVGSGNPMNVRGLRDFLRFAWPDIQKKVLTPSCSSQALLVMRSRMRPPGSTWSGEYLISANSTEAYGVVINPALPGPA